MFIYSVSGCDDKVVCKEITRVANWTLFSQNIKFKVVFLGVELNFLSDWSCQVGYTKC